MKVGHRALYWLCATHFAFVNLGFAFNQSFPIAEKLEIPVEIKFCTNPYLNQTWLVVAIGLKNRRFAG